MSMQNDLAMNVQIRQGVFETNSSSTHAITIAKSSKNLTLPYEVVFSVGEFGWEFNKYHDTNNKLKYLFTAICTCFHSVDNLLFLCDTLKENGVKFSFDIDYHFKQFGKKEAVDVINVYKNVFEYGINHQSVDSYIGSCFQNNADMVMRFLFSDKSFVATGNDNSDDYVEGDYACGDGWKSFYYVDNKISLNEEFDVDKYDKMTPLHSYLNGNVYVSIYDDGTKVRKYEKGECINPHWPESIDVKITNYCNAGCKYCHEMSNMNGKDGDLDALYNVIKVLPAGTELAIGGGNPLSHSGLVPFLKRLKSLGIIANLTVNQFHFGGDNLALLKGLVKEKLIFGLGISVTSPVAGAFESSAKEMLKITKNVIFHVIAGIDDGTIIESILNKFDSPKILILGYKEYGLGGTLDFNPIAENIEKLAKKVRGYFDKCTLSFDNLGIAQLNIIEHFSDSAWQRFYMGDDFEFTMYIDAVKQQYAESSTSDERVSFSKMDLKKFFHKREY